MNANNYGEWPIWHPVNSRICWATVIARRSDRVAGPNSLRHLDGHHSLVTWGCVIHGAIDSFSCLVVFLKCSTNNESSQLQIYFCWQQRGISGPQKSAQIMVGKVSMCGS